MLLRSPFVRNALSNIKLRKYVIIIFKGVGRRNFGIFKILKKS